MRSGKLVDMPHVEEKVHAALHGMLYALLAGCFGTQVFPTIEQRAISPW